MGFFRRTKNIQKNKLFDKLLTLFHDACLNLVQKNTGQAKCVVNAELTSNLLQYLTDSLINPILNDIPTGIGVSETFIEDLVLIQSPARFTMSDSDKKLDWKVFESLYY